LNELRITNINLPIISACDYMVCPEPFYHADRTLEFHVLIYVTEGTIYVTEDGVEYAIQAGELCFLKAGLHHFGEHEIAKGTSWYYVHFYMEEGEEQEYGYESRPMGIHEPMRYCLTLPKLIAIGKDSKVSRELRHLVELIHSEDCTKRWVANGILFGVLSELALRAPEKHGEESLAERVADYLREDLVEEFDSNRVAKHFYLSYSYLAAVFKRNQGQTMQEYHRDCRMREAAQLLRRTMLPIGEIGERVGYRDVLYFSRCFHRFSGMSPRDYRKQAKELY